MYSATPERRTKPRLLIHLPIVIRDGTQEIQAVTRDVSQAGVFFYTNSPLNVGERIEFKMVIPAAIGANSRVLCEGVVVRVEPYESAGTHKCGVAVRITDFAFAVGA